MNEYLLHCKSPSSQASQSQCTPRFSKVQYTEFLKWTLTKDAVSSQPQEAHILGVTIFWNNWTDNGCWIHNELTGTLWIRDRSIQQRKSHSGMGVKYLVYTAKKGLSLPLSRSRRLNKDHNYLGPAFSLVVYPFKNLCAWLHAHFKEHWLVVTFRR